MTGKSIVEVKKLEYGDGIENMSYIAKYWTNHLTRRGLLKENAELTPQDISILMCLLKITRLGINLKHEDSLNDLKGYTYLFEKIIEKD